MPKFFDKKFEYTDEEKLLNKSLEQLEQLEDFSDDDTFNDFHEFLLDFDVAKQHFVIQHQVNKMVYHADLMSRQEWYDADPESIKNYIQSDIYQNWFQKYACESILQNAEYSFDDLLALCEIEKQILQLQTKSYYSYRIKENIADESFADLWEEYGTHYRFGSVVTEAQISAFQEQHNVEFPDELKDFYKIVGQIINYDDVGVNIMSLSNWTESMAEQEVGASLRGIGLFDKLGYLWSYDQAYLEPDNDKGFSSLQYKYINERYIAIGSVHIDDNSNLVIYFDKHDGSGKFSFVYDNQDDNELFEDYLIPMLNPNEKSQKYSLAQLLAALIVPLSTVYFDMRLLKGVLY